MRSDLTRAAVILGVCVVLGAAVLVLGMRWAIGSALAAHLGALERLDGTLSSSADHVRQSVDDGALRVSGSMEASSEQVSATLASSAADVGRTVESSGTQVSEAMAAGSAEMRQTMLLSFERPVLIRPVEPVTIRGLLAIEGLEEGTPVDVSANIENLPVSEGRSH